MKNESKPKRQRHILILKQYSFPVITLSGHKIKLDNEESISLYNEDSKLIGHGIKCIIRSINPNTKGKRRIESFKSFIPKLIECNHKYFNEASLISYINTTNNNLNNPLSQEILNPIIDKIFEDSKNEGIKVLFGNENRTVIFKNKDLSKKEKSKIRHIYTHKNVRNEMFECLLNWDFETQGNITVRNIMKVVTKNRTLIISSRKEIDSLLILANKSQNVIEYIEEIREILNSDINIKSTQYIIKENIIMKNQTQIEKVSTLQDSMLPRIKEIIKIKGHKLTLHLLKKDSHLEKTIDEIELILRSISNNNEVINSGINKIVESVIKTANESYNKDKLKLESNQIMEDYTSDSNDNDNDIDVTNDNIEVIKCDAASIITLATSI